MTADLTRELQRAASSTFEQLGFLLPEVDPVDRIRERLEAIQPGLALNYGRLDITFHRDDFRRREEPIRER